MVKKVNISTRFSIHFIGEFHPETAVLGGKGAMLSRLKHAGFPIPPGFILGADAYKSFLNQNNLISLAESALMEANAASQLRQAILTAPLSNELVETVVGVWQTHLNGVACAVRSSAVAEDSAIASFAGQHTTRLQVTDAVELIEAVRSCWASLWSESAIAYRNKLHSAEPLMAIAIQQMIPAEISGVIFTVNPIDSSDDLLVEASWGLGETVVAGLVTPDRYLVGRDYRVLQVLVADKTIQIVPQKQGVKQIELSPEKRCDRVLDDLILGELVRLSLSVEKLLGCPQDIEWCWSQEKLYLLQARPITVQSLDPRQPPFLSGKKIDIAWSCTNTREVVPGVMSPLSRVLAASALDRGMVRFFASLGINIPVPKEGIFGFHYGRFYLNMDYVLSAGIQIPGATVRAVAEGFGYDLSYYEGNPDAKQPIRWRSLWKTMGLLHQFPSLVRTDIPNLENRLEQIRIQDFSALSLEKLSDRIKDAIALVDEIVWFHVTSSFMAGCLWNQLEKMLRSRTVLSQLTAGLSGMATAEIGFSLRRLAQIAEQEKPIRAAILSSDPQTALNKLRKSDRNFTFFENWENFLQRYGNRTFSELDILHPRWCENPEFLLQVIQGYLHHPDGETPETRIKNQRCQSQKNLWEVRKKMPFYRFWVFRWLLKNAEFYIVQRENMKDFWVRGYGVIRPLYLEVARRFLSQGLLTGLDDIFFLIPDEIEKAIADSLFAETLPDKIQQRRAEYQRDLTLNPPETIIGKWHPQNSPTPSLPHSDILQGLGCSPGIVTAPARSIRDPKNEANRLNMGDILVTAQADSALTALFLNAGGIVAELGGLLSHSAIVAREYGIPAVLGVKEATAQIRDNQILTVDGTKGLVFNNIDLIS